MCLKNVIKNASKERQKLNYYKTDVKKKYKSGIISEADMNMFNKTLDNTRAVLTENININQMRLEGYNKKGSGIKG